MGLLESITTGLYRESGDVLREYISNEIDNTPTPRLVEIRINPAAATVTIQGDGPGMNWQKFRDAVKIGVSFKDPSANVGFRGIGIWAGLAACEELIIATKSRDDDNEYELHVDCTKLRSYYQGAKRHAALTDALNDCAGYIQRKSTREPGTEVTLRGILPAFRDLLDEDSVRAYLTRECPLAFEDGFPHASEIDKKLKENVPRYRRVKMTLNNVPVKGLSAPSQMRAPIFGEITAKVGDGGKPQTLAYYWLSHAATTEAIEPSYDRGLRIRVRNFTVVDPAGVQAFLQKLSGTNMHMLNYWVGEIHAIHADFKPNAERRDLENSVAKGVLYEHVAKDVFDGMMVPWSRTISDMQNLEKETKKALEEPNTVKPANYRDAVEVDRAGREIEEKLESLRRRRKDLKTKLKKVDSASPLQKQVTHLDTEAEKAIKRLESKHKRLESLLEERRGGIIQKPAAKAKATSAKQTSLSNKASADSAELAKEATERIGSYSADPKKIVRALVQALLETGVAESEDDVREVVNRTVVILQRAR
ncbi:MAG: hypothetical protein QOE90_573 [Thermoplasmata archaeon]|nr:hypothetical protein [Thermoplasmata archaeon]